MMTRLDGPDDDPHRIVGGLLVAIMTPAKTKACRSGLPKYALRRVNAKFCKVRLPVARHVALQQSEGFHSTGCATVGRKCRVVDIEEQQPRVVGPKHHRAIGQRGDIPQAMVQEDRLAVDDPAAAITPQAVD
jgi:hypothetical protein